MRKRSDAKVRSSRSVSQRLPLPFPIAGIGASAGGLEAFTELLKHLPPDTGIGFVLVQHLAPERSSALTQLLSRATPMPVLEAADNQRVAPNCVYVIQPSTTLTIKRGLLKLRPRRNAPSPIGSIDCFLESLAHDQHQHAIGVVLSGTAKDGTLGLEAIKAEGGITFAQDDSAKYDSMPHHAIATGCVDFVLNPEDIAKELARIAQHPYVAGQQAGVVSSGDAKREPLAPSAQPPPIARQGKASAINGGQDWRQQILLLLRNYSGVDFSLYKPTSIQRRIARRMVLKKQDTLQQYADLLRASADELAALNSDLLISVTSFFRNPEAFEVLQAKVFAKLLQERGNHPLRVWVLGCSTGQEAYSIAMAFAEVAEKAARNRTLQVFATDVNANLLDKARRGLYSKSLVQEISPERLRRFFVEEDGGYRVVKSLRESIVFARQNLITDPPFSRMDLISCRNLLIYLEPKVQAKALATFHYALNPGGFLFLGASESTDGFAGMFEAVDKRQKLYCRKPAPLAMSLLPLKGDRRQHNVRGQEANTGSPLSAPDVVEDHLQGVRGDLDAQREADRVTVNQFSPPGVLINSEMQILQFRGPTDPYLQPPSTGKARFDLLKMAREGLMVPLRDAINKAKKVNKPVRKENVAIYEDHKVRRAHVEVVPLKNLKAHRYLVFFEDAEKAPPRTGSGRKMGNTASTRRASGKDWHDEGGLERQLAETRDYLESILEQREAANQELQVSSEEAQSANEELQSINEELETSKEELETTNEELIATNEELARRNTELSHLNADWGNLLTATALPIVLLARDLTVRRFSPQAERQFNLQAGDAGRPLRGLRHGIELPELESLLQAVVAEGRGFEREIQDQSGRWFSLRVSPYLTQERKVEGAVVVLLDVDALKRAERQATEAHLYAQAVVDDAPPLLILDEHLRVVSANEQFCNHFKVSRAETTNTLVYKLGNGQWNIPKLRKFLEGILPRNSSFTDFEVVHDFATIGRRTMLLSGRRLDHLRHIILFIADITERVEARENVRVSELRFRRLFESTKDGILMLDAETRRITNANPSAEAMLGYSRDQLNGKGLCSLGLLRDIGEEEAAFQRMREGKVACYDHIPLSTKDGRALLVELVGTLYHEQTNEVAYFNLRDITERSQIEAELLRTRDALANEAATLERLVRERTADLSASTEQLETFVYSMAHDLRAPLRAMQGFAVMLASDAGTALSETGKDCVERIDKSAQFMDALLIDLLAFSRVSQQPVELAAVPLENVVDSVLSRLQGQIDELRAQTEISGPWPSVLAHQPTLMQMLFNLVSNALKFISPDREPRVCLRAEEQGAFIRLWVEDNGVGIAPNHQEQIFRVFTRLHGERYPGTGVGLAIVQKGAHRMGGRAGVESAAGEGSRFWIDLRKA